MKLELKNKADFVCVETLDLHTEGEPLRIVTDGYPDIPGNTMLEKRAYVLANLDHLRQMLMFEPRGHADMYGAIITEAVTQDGDFGILFMHNEGYSSMCGHAILATVTAMVKTGEIVFDAPDDNRTIKIDSPAGRILAYAQNRNGALQISFDCVPSFVEVADHIVKVDGLGEVQFDIAFGGAYYAYVDADKLDLDCSPNNVDKLIHYGRAIKHEVSKQYKITHPEQSDLGFLYGTIFTSSQVKDSASHSKHVCIFADGEVDRSPTGTGVSGRIALLHHKGLIAETDQLKIESIIGSSMLVGINETLAYFAKKAVTPRVSGSAYITGRHEFLLDPQDPIKQGFLLR